jgi:peptidoglycan/LPS O-acetylase OafA/YrhL
MRAISSGEATPQNPHGDGAYIPALDGWRAVAIVLVMLFHGLHNSDLTGRIAKVGALAARLGALGVLVFFVISGYLITNRLFVESLGSGRVSLRAFFTKRAFRILPPMFAVLLVTAALGLAHVIQLVPRDWLAAVFLTDYWPGSWFTNHFWSLSVEEHFYLVWPIIIVAAGWKRSLWIGVGLIAIVGLWRAYLLAHIALPQADPEYAHVKGLILGRTDTRLDYIMFGCVFALAIVYYPVMLRVLQLAGTGFGQLVLLVLLFATTRNAPVDTRTLQAAIIGLLVCGSANQSSFFSKHILGSRVMVFLGKISYSLYLWQELFLTRSDVEWLRQPAALLLKYAVAIGVACLSFHFLERPLIRKGRSIIDGWKQREIVAD